MCCAAHPIEKHVTQGAAHLEVELVLLHVDTSATLTLMCGTVNEYNHEHNFWFARIRQNLVTEAPTWPLRSISTMILFLDSCS